MKKALFRFICFCVIALMCSCSQATSETPTPQSQIETNESLNVLDLTSTPIQSQHLKADDLNYTRVLGIRKEFPNSLPEPIAYDKPNIFYENMSAVMKNSPYANDILAVGKYDSQAETSTMLGTLSMQMMSNSRLYVNDRYLFYMPHRLAENGETILDIILFDTLEGTQKTVASFSSGSVFTYSKQLNESEVVFFFYEQPNFNVRQLSQKIIRYNIALDEVQILYSGDFMDWNADPSTKDIWAIDTFNDDIYLLLHQFRNNKMKTFLQILNANGEKTSEVELNALSSFSSKEMTVDEITVFENYLFLHYANGRSVILKSTNNGYVNVKPNNISFKNLISPNLIDGRYLFFNVGQGSGINANSLFVFDTLNQEGIILKFDVQNANNILSDKNGNILIKSIEETQDCFYTIDCEIVLQNLQQAID